MLYSVTPKKEKEAILSLNILYKKIPNTKGCMEYIGKPESEGGCGAWCCRLQTPQVLYSEFLNTWTNVKSSFLDGDFKVLIERCLRKYLYPNLDRGCVFLNKETNMCAQHETRPFNCRVYGIIPEEEFKPRYERLKVIYPDIRNQCNLVSTTSGNKITKKDTDSWWLELKSIEMRIGIKPELISDANGGSYRTYHDYILIHLLGEESMCQLSDIRVYGSDIEKEQVIQEIIRVLNGFKEQKRAKSTEDASSQRVKIIESKYLEDSDLISWTLKFADSGTEQTYVWPSTDLLSCLNIKGKATPKMLHKFCSDMTGKDINFVIDEEPNLPKPAAIAEYQGLSEGLREYFGRSKKNAEGE